MSNDNKDLLGNVLPVNQASESSKPKLYTGLLTTDSIGKNPGSSPKRMVPITPKMFLHRSQQKAANSATAFIGQYRTWLETGELAVKTSPILSKIDAGEVLPTPGLDEIRKAVLSHLLIIEARELEEKMSSQELKERSSSKLWNARILNGKGELMMRPKENRDGSGFSGDYEDLDKNFEKASQADGWVDRQLFDGASDWYGEISHQTLGLATRIERGDSLARILKPNKQPFGKKMSPSTSSLSFKPVVKSHKVHFSRG